jgi:hypothetical protein
MSTWAILLLVVIPVLVLALPFGLPVVYLRGTTLLLGVCQITFCLALMYSPETLFSLGEAPRRGGAFQPAAWLVLAAIPTLVPFRWLVTRARRVVAFIAMAALYSISAIGLLCHDWIADLVLVLGIVGLPAVYNYLCAWVWFRHGNDTVGNQVV